MRVSGIGYAELVLGVRRLQVNHSNSVRVMCAGVRDPLLLRLRYRGHSRVHGT